MASNTLHNAPDTGITASAWATARSAAAPYADEKVSIAVVVPFKWSWIKPTAILRLWAQCVHLHRLGMRNITISDGTRWHWPVRLFARLLGVRHIPVRCEPYYSPALIKNSAARVISDSPYLLFLDVDVLLTEGSVRCLQDHTRRGTAFLWLPVIFLDNSQATLKMLSHGLIYHDCADVTQRTQIGYTTGIHLIDRCFFNFLDGYNELFEGYGCEDIEMIHRATGTLMQRPFFTSDAEYFLDIRNHDPQKLGGFRRFFFELTKDIPLDCMPVHYWHKRKNKSNYILQRKHNDELLLQLMIKFDAWQRAGQP